jgi:hypothetical protein
MMKQSDDQTLFAWQIGFEKVNDDISGPLVPYPTKFQGADYLLPVLDTEAQSPYSVTNKGLRIKLPVVHQNDDAYGMAVLHCSTYSSFAKRVGLPVLRLGHPGTYRYARDARYIRPLVAVDVATVAPKTIFLKQESDQELTVCIDSSFSPRDFFPI